MALIGEMKYLTIGGNTYSIPEPELPIASSSTLGGIKVGSGLTIDGSTGVLTATGTSITIDTAMSDSSTNTVQNKVIKSYVDTNIPTKVSDLQNDSGFTTNTGTVTSVGAQNATNGGLTISGSPVTTSGTITIGHSNVLTSAQTTQAVYPIKIDKNGHISAYGSAVSIPSKTSDLTNDSGFITDAGVTSFNGDTGAITYTAPVTSVNGNTGAVTIAVPTASSTTPAMDGTAATGSETTFARGDHVHPTDTSRAATTAVTTQASIGSDGLITYKNSGNTSLYTVQLPLFDGSSGASSLDFLPLGGGTITGNLTVNGTTTLGSTLGVSGKITGENGLDITGATTTQGNLSVNGTVTSTGLLTASGGISTTTISTSGNSTIGGTLGVTGAATLSSTLGVTGNSTLSTLTTSGKITANSGIDIIGNSTLDGNLSIDGTTTSTGLITANSGISTTTLTTSGNTTINGDLSVTGDMSADDMTVNGALSVTNRRSAILSDVAAGWHRVLEFSPTTVEHRLGRAGIIIDFDITRFGTTNETHHVSLSLIETNAKFYGELSNSNTKLIDKIRYTYDSSKGYVDIHLSTSWSANVAVDYQVSASAGSFLRLITTKSLAAVADTPTGETVLTEYALNANGAGDITYNGDATVGGVLDVTNRRAAAQLSTAGWYRVMTYAGTSTYQPDGATGALIRFNVAVWGNTSINGNHQIDLSTVYGTGHREFVNEFSNGQDTLIDKIRYTKKDNNFYVDVHFTGNSDNLVIVYFDPYIYAAFQDKITSGGLASVADAPDGETVVTTYTFSQTGVYFNNVTINGVLNENNRRCAAALSSAGWYRIIQYTAPSAAIAGGRYSLLLEVSVGDTISDSHTVTLNTQNSNFYWLNEVSTTDSTKYFDKIRYTTIGAVAYVDVHYTATTARTVWAYFNPKTIVEYNSRFTAVNFEAVNDAPTGETIETTYTFNSNAELTLGGYTITKPTAQSATRDTNFSTASNFAMAVYPFKAFGFVWCKYNIQVPALTAATYYTMCTLPSGTGPTSDTYYVLPGQVNSNYLIRITASTRVVEIYSNNGTSSSQWVRGTFIYPI